MDVSQAVIQRRSVRRFQDKPVPYDVLEKCVDAGRLAPSAKNRQLCEFIIVNDEQLLPRVFDCLTGLFGQLRTRGGLSSSSAPKAYIAILINSALETEFAATRRVTTYDVGMSAENMMLVALEQGIGTCAMLSFLEDKLKPILNVPDNYDIDLLVALGYPDESPVMEVSNGLIGYRVDEKGVRHVPKRKLKDITHHNKFP